MPSPVLLTVRATITPEMEREFNEWYDNHHVPDMVRLSGCRSGTRYRVVDGDGSHQYMALYEFDDLETLERFRSSEGQAWLISEYDKAFGDASARVRTVYERTGP